MKRETEDDYLSNHFALAAKNLGKDSSHDSDSDTIKTKKNGKTYNVRTQNGTTVKTYSDGNGNTHTVTTIQNVDGSYTKIYKDSKKSTSYTVTTRTNKDGSYTEFYSK